MKKPCEMNAGEWSEALSRRLTEVFGKDTFAKEELTKDFWVDFTVSCHEFFENEDGLIDHYGMLGEETARWLTEQDKSRLCTDRI